MKSSKKKILFVCGYSFLLESYSLRLRQNSFEVYSLEDANGDFIEKVVGIKPDLIYLYIVLPGRDGFEALKLLKTDSRTKDIPVVFENKKSNEEDIIKGIDLGALDYLVDEYTDTEIVARAALDYLKNSEKYIPRYPVFIDMLKAKHLNIKISEVVKEKLKAIGIKTTSDASLFFGEDLNTPQGKYFVSKYKTKSIIYFIIFIIILFLLKLYFVL